MKRYLIYFVSFCLLLCLGCTVQETPVTVELSYGTTTLMIYMVGSDLEAKAGAATRDLDEIANSGIDLEKNQVVVMTGGSPKWHNDFSEEESLCLLELTTDGFVKKTSAASGSMGDAKPLSEFLQYAVANYPADNYALVMWDHGNGPIIGYGKDMLFDNDSLTLTEMREAMEASPFSRDNKLAWVGFDACLMSSAELCCIWGEYADYLVASQEIEPSFGWDYSFLSSLSKTDIRSLLKTITNIYLTTCEAYYQERGYEGRDTTLACMDLSYTQALSDSIDALFSKASGDINARYPDFAVRRVDTRALGRASTGSEYDLVDLADMVKQLEDIYPEESGALIDVISNMIVSNDTNATAVCGLSIYYPYYNKSFYENEWKKKYDELNIFPAYVEYLGGYAQNWIGNDLLESVAKSVMPSRMSEHEFVLELTDEQAANFADASYYVLCRDGKELYRKVFSSGDVTRVGNQLIAEYDGYAIYMKNPFNEYILIDCNEYDTIGDISRYSAYVQLVDFSWKDLDDFSFGNDMLSGRFQIGLNKSTKEISVSSLLAEEAEVDASALNSGKLEDLNTEGYTTFQFWFHSDAYVSRYDNDVMKPFAQWKKSGTYRLMQFEFTDGYSFEYAPLANGEYYLMFEVEDIQGNRYSSELLPVQISGSLPNIIYPDPIEVAWENGDEIKLCEAEGVSVWLTTIDYFGTVGYTLRAENMNDEQVLVRMEDIVCDGSIYVDDGLNAQLVVDGNSTLTNSSPIDFGDAALFELADGIDTLQFSIEIVRADNLKHLLYDQSVIINFGESKRLPIYPSWLSYDTHVSKPCRGYQASTQVVYESKELRITLLEMGAQNADGLSFAVCYENLTNHVLYAGVEGVVLDGIYEEAGTALMIPAGCKVYCGMKIYKDDLDRAGVDSISQVSLQLKFAEYEITEGGGGFSNIEWIDVVPDVTGKPASFFDYESVLFDAFGIKICMRGYDQTADSPCWNLVIYNNSGYDISVDMTDATLNGTEYIGDEQVGQGFSYSRMGSGQKRASKLVFYNTYPLESMSFRVVITDFIKESVLYTAEEPIVVYTE